LGIDNETLRDKFGEVGEKWLTESKNRIKLICDEARKDHIHLQTIKIQIKK